jgi:hypothetical protein
MAATADGTSLAVCGGAPLTPRPVTMAPASGRGRLRRPADRNRGADYRPGEYARSSPFLDHDARYG